MSATPKVLLLGQALTPETALLAHRCAEELGETWIFTSPVFDHQGDHPRLKRFDAPAYDNSTLLTRIRSWVSYIWAAWRFTRRMDGAPAVFLNTNPPILALLGYLGARKKRRPYMVQILDVYPDVMVQRGMMGSGHPIARIWRGFNRRIFSRAAAVLTLGEVMAERVRPYVSADTQLDVIPTSVDTSDIVPRAKSDNWFVEEHGLLDDLVILYSGNYGASHDLSGLIAAMDGFTADEKVTFLFIGGAGRAAELQAAADQHPDVGRYLPFQPMEALPYSMTSGDIAVVTLGAGTEGISMPSKCYYMMAAGCAILALSEGDNDLKRVIETYECGVSLSCSDTEGIAAAIKRLRQEPETLARYQRNARKAAEEVFDSQIVIGKQFDILRAMLESRDA